MDTARNSDLKTSEKSPVGKSAACKRLPKGTSKELRRQMHRLDMQLRRRGQLARTPGFTPVRNKRISAAVDAQEILITADALERGLNLTPMEIRDQAVSNVARMLPRPPMVRSYHRRPSRSDDPAYRKSIWPAAKVAKRSPQFSELGGLHAGGFFG